MKKGYQKVYEVYIKYLPLVTGGFFLIGIWFSHCAEWFADGIDVGMSAIIDFYGWVAPVAIFLILAPALVRIINIPKGKNGKSFGGIVVRWFAIQRFVSCFFAAIFTSVVLGFPLFINHTQTFGEAFLKGLNIFKTTATQSSYFHAIYLAILTVWLAKKRPVVERFLNKSSDIVEKLGCFFVPMVPFFMLAIGSYVAHLNVNITNQVETGDMVLPSFQHLNIFGIVIPVQGSYGMLWVYLGGTALTALACWLWHGGLLLFVKWKFDGAFSIRSYFRQYWSRVYPLLWATSSESLAMPLNLHLVKKYYPHVPSEVRHFSVGGGSFLSINGTMICVFVLAGVMAQILGIPLSLLDFLFMLPIIFIMGYGVPGIPGELLLFGGPIVTMLSLSPEIAPVFLALYVGLQIGLPDSFRTGANSTDNCLSALLLEKIYREQFSAVDKKVVVGGVVGSISSLAHQPVLATYRAEARHETVNDVRN